MAKHTHDMKSSACIKYLTKKKRNLNLSFVADHIASFLLMSYYSSRPLREVISSVKTRSLIKLRSKYSMITDPFLPRKLNFIVKKRKKFIEFIVDGFLENYFFDLII